MATNKIRTLWVIGGGNMGGALLSRWCLAKVADRIVLVDPANIAVPAGCEKFPSIADVDGIPDIVVGAVKPHLAATALATLSERLDERSLFISVMAGLGLARIAALVPAGTPVRAMPNTPAQVGRGVTGLYADDLTEEQRMVVSKLFNAVGITHWLTEEGQFDALTAVSGSGPAYVFRMVEALAAAGIAAGLPEKAAHALARGTIIGAGELLRQDERSATELRVAVTSPNGTTQAGLEALDEEPGLPAVVRSAVRAAAARSREMGQEDQAD
ncbi:pyrroline-5-carboxylate reductase [Pacificimonas sp. WHA3]|uniref:Pyrroline-5-carboxylate reductase n=1 Tax=Pacificimonas pallii TaxID=2827236 RepID=A0ABS6SES2_9SPHN|nr:pyrroline-5-carboxylate reductase [Pacificimonas pallii]MBV7256899.1 pyrroline-5-carboxylate reductase [Pacificimonas pallii]